MLIILALTAIAVAVIGGVLLYDTLRHPALAAKDVAIVEAGVKTAEADVAKAVATAVPVSKAT